MVYLDGTECSPKVQSVASALGNKVDSTERVDEILFTLQLYKNRVSKVLRRGKSQGGGRTGRALL